MRNFVLMLIMLCTSLTCNAQWLSDGSNATLGKVESSGYVVDSSNRTLGKVLSDGTVVDSHNSTIGYARGVPKTYAAVFFFFDFF